MTGWEGAALAIGGRLLKGLATPAAQALTSRVAYRRWMIWWYVHNRVDFACHWRTYREWLKTITAEELDRPVEEGQAPLAKRLDEALSAASKAWSTSPDHLSNALRLVELTYPAIAASYGDGARVQLAENWAHQRNAGVRELLLQLAGPGAAVSSADFAIVLERRSEARRAVRLQAFGFDEAVLASHFGRIEVLNVPADAVVVLIGDFGSGKSEIAEAWHRSAINVLATQSDAPLPVWLSARELSGQSLEAAVERQLGPTWRHGRGASIVIDGADETDIATAQALLDAARILSKTYGNSRVLITARPGTLSPAPTEKAQVELLLEDEALDLVMLAGGKSHHTWHWTTAMRATVTRPFFALAAGSMLGRDERPHGEADLIRGLVESALERGRERSAVTSAETRSVLTKLAVALTRSDADGLSFSERQSARSSRLVADGRDGSVLFSLPIFQHWFAAQAILTGEVPAGEVIANSVHFNRWRWAAAVAALSAPKTESVDDLLTTWVAGNPGAAAWILKTAFSGYRSWRTSDDESLDPNTSGPRLLRALRTWSDALGPLASGIVPWPVVRGHVGLGVTVSGRRIDVALSTALPATDYVTDVPPGVHPFVQGAVPDWIPWSSGAAPQGNAWPWIMVQNRIAGKTREKLSKDPFLGAPEGIWVQERRFDLARRLLDQGSPFRTPLPADRVREQAAGLLNALRRGRGTRIEISASAACSGAELEDLISWIDRTSTTHVLSHLPDADMPNRSGPWIWDLYSPQRLMEFEVEVYGRACEAYDEALDHAFTNLGWSMPASAFAPFGVLLEIQYDDAATRLGSIPGLIAMRVPMPMLAGLVSTDAEATWSTSGRAVVTRSNDEPSANWDRYESTVESICGWLAEQNRELTGGLGWTSTGADDMSKRRPASSLAAHWLWDDLNSIGLAAGTSPQLE